MKFIKKKSVEEDQNGPPGQTRGLGETFRKILARTGRRKAPAADTDENASDRSDLEGGAVEPPGDATVPGEAASKPRLADRLRGLKARKAPKLSAVKQKLASDKKILAAKKAITTSPEISKQDVGTITFGKKKVALGMQWVTAEEGRGIKATLEEHSELSHNDPAQMSVNYKFYTDDRRTGFIGIGSSDLGHTVGMKILVTMLSPDITGPRWIGAFPLGEANDSWWVGSMRDGKIFSDQLVSSRHQAEEILLGDLQAPDWTAIFAPKEWGIAEARSERLYELVDMRIGEKLKSSTPIKDNLPRAILGVMVVAVGVGGYVYYEQRKAEELRQLEELRRKAEQGMTFGPSDLPWYRATELATFIDVCAAEIDKALVMVPGWENQPISCSIRQGAGSVVTGWARNGGRSAMLRAAIDPALPAPVFADTADTASWTLSFEAPYSTNEMSVEPWNENLIQPRLVERFQNLGLPLAIRPAAGNISRATNQVVFNSHEVRVNASFGVANFGDMLADVPAVVADALIYSPATGNWDLALKVFHPPLLPPQVQ